MDTYKECTDFGRNNLECYIGLNNIEYRKYKEMNINIKPIYAKKVLCLNENDVLSAFGMLLDKNLLTLVSTKNDSGKIVDKISLENLYSGIKKSSDKDKADKQKSDFFTNFQKEYAHTLSSMDLELVKAWLDSGFSEELILGAVKEANYNGVASLSYIDKVLFAWKKKGFKTMEDVTKHLTKQDDSEDESMFETSVFEINWLDDEQE